MSYMKNLDLSERFSKLSDAQKNAVINIMSGGTEKIHPSTYKALQSRELIIKNGEGWELEASFKAELLAAIDRPEPREAELPEWEQELLAEMSEDKAAIIREEMETEFSESNEDAPVIPFFNRAARREARRNIARYNRRLMRLQGKRARKYGAENVIIKHIAA